MNSASIEKSTYFSHRKSGEATRGDPLRPPALHKKTSKPDGGKGKPEPPLLITDPKGTKRTRKGHNFDPRKQRANREKQVQKMHTFIEGKKRPFESV